MCITNKVLEIGIKEMKTKEEKSAIILIKSLRVKASHAWEANSNSARLEHLKKLIRELEEEFKVH